MTDLEKLTEYVISLKEDSFEGWSEDERSGYLTALRSVEHKIKQLSEYNEELDD